MSISFQDRVVIVTGAGGGLGHAHAMQFARYGATVVVNDMGPAAAAVAAQIEAAGGRAFAADASVTDYAAVSRMVADTLARYGRIDALVNNAGILRDKTFAKMELEDFRAVLDVHVMGAVHCTKAVWPAMRERKYGRIVMTTSSSGLYGNFGQSNYGAAKMALVGLMNVLALEGARDNIHVNAFAPTARTRMTEGVVPAPLLEAFDPEATSAAVLFLASSAAPNKTIVAAGGGTFERAYITLTAGEFLAAHERTPEALAAKFDAVGARAGELIPENGPEQGRNEALRAAAAQAPSAALPK